MANLLVENQFFRSLDKELNLINFLKTNFDRILYKFRLKGSNLIEILVNEKPVDSPEFEEVGGQPVKFEQDNLGLVELSAYLNSDEKLIVDKNDLTKIYSSLNF